MCCEPPVNANLCESNTSSVKGGVATRVSSIGYNANARLPAHLSHVLVAVRLCKLQKVGQTGLCQPPSKEEALPKVPPQALDARHTPIKGTVASTPGGKMRLASVPTVALTPKVLHSHSLHKDAPTGKHPFGTTVGDFSF